MRVMRCVLAALAGTVAAAALAAGREAAAGGTVYTSDFVAAVPAMQCGEPGQAFSVVERLGRGVSRKP